MGLEASVGETLKSRVSRSFACPPKGGNAPPTTDGVAGTSARTAAAYLAEKSSARSNEFLGSGAAIGAKAFSVHSKVHLPIASSVLRSVFARISGQSGTRLRKVLSRGVVRRGLAREHRPANEGREASRPYVSSSFVARYGFQLRPPHVAYDDVEYSAGIVHRPQRLTPKRWEKLMRKQRASALTP